MEPARTDAPCSSCSCTLDPPIPTGSSRSFAIQEFDDRDKAERIARKLMVDA